MDERPEANAGPPEDQLPSREERFGGKDKLVEWLKSLGDAGAHLLSWGFLLRDGKPAKVPFTGWDGHDSTKKRLPKRETSAASFERENAFPGYLPGSVGLVHFDIDEPADVPLEKVEAAFPGLAVVRSFGDRGWHAIGRLPEGIERWAVRGSKWKRDGMSGEVLCMSRWAAIRDEEALATIMLCASQPDYCADAPAELLSLRQPKPARSHVRKRTGGKPDVQGLLQAAMANANGGKLDGQGDDPPDLDADLLADLLDHIDGDGGHRDRWMNVGMACKAAVAEIGSDDAAWAAFDDWSRRTASDNYSEGENRTQWDGFEPAEIGPGSLFHWAKQGGWKGARPDSPPPPAPESEKSVRVGGDWREPVGTKSLDMEEMGRLHPRPEDVLYWPERKMEYTFDKKSGLWRLDPHAVRTRALLQRVALRKTYQHKPRGAKKATPHYYNIRPSCINAGLEHIRLVRAREDPPWDEDPYIVGTPGGVIDLRTGTLRSGRRDEHVSRRLGVRPFEGDYEPEAPVFDAFHAFAFEHEPAVGDFFMAALASMLGGEEHLAFYFQGVGGSGKTTTVKLVKALFGGYYGSFPQGTLTKERAGQNLHPQWRTKLRGKRVAVAPETQSKTFIDAAELNDWTGGGTQTGYAMRSQYQETWESTVRVVLYGNQTPRIDVNSGVERRLHLIRMTRAVAKANRDYDLSAKLAAEAPVILHRLVRIFRENECTVGDVPNEVAAASSSYLEGADPIKAFMTSELALDPPDLRRDARRATRTTKKEMQRALNRFYDSEGIGGKVPQATRVLRPRFDDLDPPVRPGAAASGRFWRGVGLKRPLDHGGGPTQEK